MVGSFPCKMPRPPCGMLCHKHARVDKIPCEPWQVAPKPYLNSPVQAFLLLPEATSFWVKHGDLVPTCHLAKFGSLRQQSWLVVHEKQGAHPESREGERGRNPQNPPGSWTLISPLCPPFPGPQSIHQFAFSPPGQKKVQW